MKITNQTHSDYWDNDVIRDSSLGIFDQTLIQFGVKRVDFTYVANIKSGDNTQLKDFEIKFSRMTFYKINKFGGKGSDVVMIIVYCLFGLGTPVLIYKIVRWWLDEKAFAD